ncbi:iron-containing alcohol dehydrogenase [Pseudomonas sp. CAN2814]|uniref:iron-containing alcohol dehydrogenase n=1 Tax=Pseudomonas sp. CAN1 TaxID=3046726 RepID=UPI0026477FAE|nr:iron-containing alcohol dehydrogenase [Pseudomonas sp. CAN1]MDN6859393.1 iron-containing alcohol dehydrogenase [Pseudomonas sp. CAN1]
MIDNLSPLSRQSWSLPLPIEYGPGARSALVELCRRYGISRPLIVTDQGSLRLPFVAELQDLLNDAGLACGLFGEIEPNPSDRAVLEGAAAFRELRADGIIALGGGSGLDGGKAVALVARQTRLPLWAFDFDKPVPEGLVASDFPPVICIPTTAGTGAETESTAMLTDSERAIKGCVWHPLARPQAVILDPELTLSLPAHLTAWTGLDAVIHALEAYFVPTFNPLCDGAALQALELLWGSLERAVEQGDDLEARGRMLIGSCLAGVAFLKGLGLVHALSHMVGATYNSHHGLTNAMILPRVLRFNRAAIEPRLGPVCRAMGLAGEDFESFQQAICARLDSLAIPVSLASLGLRREDIAAIARKAMGDPARQSNPRPSSLEDLESLLHQALEEERA